MNKKTNNKLIGVIHALPLEIAMKIFQDNKEVFIKYMPHEPSRKSEAKLKNGMKLYLYISKANKSVIGEAKIRNIQYLNAREILKKFKKRLMLSEAELLLYAEGREDKKAQVMELSNILLYPKEIPVNTPITMGGSYVTLKNKLKIFGRK